MWDSAVFGAIIGLGLVTGIYGWRILKGRRPPRAMFLERPLLRALALRNPREEALILGRLRLVYALFLIVLGVWGLRF